MVNDPKTNFTTLRLDWASPVNCEQRKGRTGRVMNGRCYRLVPYDFYNIKVSIKQLFEHITRIRLIAVSILSTKMRQRNDDPELLRSPLEVTILKAKILDMGTPEEILALAMQKPVLSNISYAILHLKEIGAMYREKGRISDRDGEITFMGRVMAEMPLNVELTKLLILGYCFSVLDECITIGIFHICSV